VKSQPEKLRYLLPLIDNARTLGLAVETWKKNQTRVEETVAGSTSYLSSRTLLLLLGIVAEAW